MIPELVISPFVEENFPPGSPEPAISSIAVPLTDGKSNIVDLENAVKLLQRYVCIFDQVSYFLTAK